MAWRRAAQAQRAWATPTEAASGEEGGVHLWGGVGEFHTHPTPPTLPRLGALEARLGLGLRERPWGTE